MKKILVLFFAIIVLLSCTDSDDSNLNVSSFTADNVGPSIDDLVTLSCTASDAVGTASYEFTSVPQVALTSIGSDQVSFIATTSTITITCTATDTVKSVSKKIAITGIDPNAVPLGVTYRVEIAFHWTASSHASQPNFPGGAHFTSMPFIVHNSSVVYWASGERASSQLEPLAELGNTSSILNLANNDENTLSVVSVLGNFAAEDTKSLEITLNKDFSLVTSATMIAPSPDWFTGVRNINLLDYNVDTEEYSWQQKRVVGLRGYDAGTAGGITFKLNAASEEPREDIHLLTNDSALKVAGFNIAENFGTITFTLK